MKTQKDISKGHEFHPYYWDSEKYDSFEEAFSNDGVHTGEVCYGYSAYADAMTNVKTVAAMYGHEKTLIVHLVMDDKVVGDFIVWDSYS